MKFPKNVKDSESESKRNGQQHKVSSSGGCDRRQLSDGKHADDGDSTNCIIEPNSTALIPPWIKNTFGLTDKALKTTAKTFKTLTASQEKDSSREMTDVKTHLDEELVKADVAVTDCTGNPIIEVNIGHETDFSDNTADPRKSWRSRGSKYNQYDRNIFSIGKDKRIVRSIKSEVTSIDVVVPLDDNIATEEEKKKSKSHRQRNKTGKRYVLVGPKGDEDHKTTTASDVPSKNNSQLTMRQMDTRLLMLCGKSKVENLTEEDISLLREMRNQLGHKEGMDKLFNEIKESSLSDALMGMGKDGKVNSEEKREEKWSEASDKLKHRKGSRLDNDHGRISYCRDVKNDGSDTKMMTKSKAVDEERGYLGEVRSHYEKKRLSQQRSGRICQEGEVEKKVSDRSRPTPSKARYDRLGTDRERKSKSKLCECPTIEKAVSETLHKFIELYQFQIPPDIVSSMKKNIVQNLQSENPERGDSSEKYISATSLPDGLGNDSALLLEDKFAGYDNELKLDDSTLTGLQRHSVSTRNDEAGISRELSKPSVHVQTSFIDIFDGPTRFGKENDVEANQILKDLRKDFEKCLSAIQTQLDITGTRLCSVALDKTDIDDPSSNRKLRIVHNFCEGVTESTKVYNDKYSLGSPEGDNFNTSAKVCDCQRDSAFRMRVETANESVQTCQIEMSSIGIQTYDSDMFLYHVTSQDTYRPSRIISTLDMSNRSSSPEVVTLLPRQLSRVIHRPEEAVDEFTETASRDSFLSERGPEHVSSHSKLDRKCNSDYVGLNLCELFARDSRGSLVNFISPLLEKESSRTVRLRDVSELKDEGGDGMRNGKHEDLDEVNPDGYHMGCVWLWNGKKMDPGVDLKVHVENLLREKLKEILREMKNGDDENKMGQKEQTNGESKNLEIRKTHGTFCITNDNKPFTAVSPRGNPFIFGKNCELVPSSEDVTLKDINRTYTVREIGTQNSRSAISGVSVTRAKPRSKLCTVARFTGRRSKRQLTSYRSRGSRDKVRSQSKPLTFAGNVGEAKKVKLEYREMSDRNSNPDAGSNADSVQECYSIMSNESSSSIDGQVRVKLIGIEVSKERRPPGDGDSFEMPRKVLESNRFPVEGYPSKVSSTRSRDHSSGRRFKHWELIENVLSRVSQQEKDSLWDDIRDFVKKKIGRDINDEGAREVCIEIEQDLPKLSKGNSDQTVVARGNYSRNEGDVEVEVDLTLDDLESILRRRQRKLKRRKHQQQQQQHQHYHKAQVECKKSLSLPSSCTSNGEMNYNGDYRMMSGSSGGECFPTSDRPDN